MKMSISKISELLPARLNWKAITFLFTLIVMVTFAYMSRPAWVNQVCEKNICLNRFLERGNLKKTDTSISYFVLKHRVSSEEEVSFNIQIKHEFGKKLNSNFNYFMGIAGEYFDEIKFNNLYYLSSDAYPNEVMFVRVGGENLSILCSGDAGVGVCDVEWVYAEIFSIFVSFLKKDINSFDGIYLEAQLFSEKAVEISK